MSRNKPLTVLQKTYDDSYLSCSTAVYHESQGNEVEAMRHWRSALDQIYEHNANKVLPTYAPRNDTEKALMDALRQLELQCKERIDLLEALRMSREDGPSTLPSVNNGKLTKSSDSHEPSSRSKGSIGQGTVPAVSYSDLSRPVLPSRPSLPNRTSAEVATGGGVSSNSLPTRNRPSRSSLATPKSRSPARPSDQQVSPRSQSPEKYTMRTTLRSGKSSDKQPMSTRKASRPLGEGSSKAATLAWGALTSREKPGRSGKLELDIVKSSAAPSGGQRHTSEQTRNPSLSQLQWDSHSRRLIPPPDPDLTSNGNNSPIIRHSDEYLRPSLLSVSAASSALTSSSADLLPTVQTTIPGSSRQERYAANRAAISTLASSAPERKPVRKSHPPIPPKPLIKTSRPLQARASPRDLEQARFKDKQFMHKTVPTSGSNGETGPPVFRQERPIKEMSDGRELGNDSSTEDSEESNHEDLTWKRRKDGILKDLPSGVDESAAKQILNDIVVQGDQVHWGDIAGLEIAKNALREAVVYPFLRPDLFMGLREPARGMLLFGPPGTGKTMLARAVATESRSTFFSISASSLTSKFLGESEKLVRALFGLAKVLAPSIIFVDEIDSLLSQRSGSGEHEATRRIKTEFLIQWSDLQRAAAGRETTDRDKERGDANRVLVLAATNLPWAIDEAARRRFVRRQYIPLPEPSTRETQLRTLLGQQKHGLSNGDINKLVDLTDGRTEKNTIFLQDDTTANQGKGFSGSDITALAKDAAMGPLRSLGEALLHMTMDDIRPITLTDFETSLGAIRPSVSKSGLKEYEDWAREFGERGG